MTVVADQVTLTSLVALERAGEAQQQLLRDGEVEMIPEALPYLERVEELERLTEEELVNRFVEEFDAEVLPPEEEST